MGLCQLGFHLLCRIDRVPWHKSKRHRHVVMMVAGDEVYVRDYHYADRSGVIVRAPTMIILQKHSQPRSMVQRHEIVTFTPLLYSATKVRIMSISCCHVSDSVHGQVIAVCAMIALGGFAGQATSKYVTTPMGQGETKRYESS